MGAKPKFYMVYLAKNDSIVAVGTAEECAKQLGLRSVKVFYDIVGKTRKGKLSRYEIVIEDEGELE